jgi:hypothetical protein
VPGLFPNLRGIIDQGRWEGLNANRFLILGSASFDLLRQSGESLAGRTAYIDMTPLMVTEIAPGHVDRDQLWLRGGFPASYLARSAARSLEWRHNFIRTFLERDVPVFGFNLPAETLRRLWTMLAHRQGGLLNAADLARSLSVGSQSVGRYIDLLVDLLMVRRLNPYHANVGKRLTKAPKIYIRDSGFVHALLDIGTIEQLAGHPVLGMSWEGFVIENLLSALPWNSHAFFYRTQAGAELDLVIEFLDFSTWAIEIKRGIAAPTSRGFHIARADIKAARSFVVHSGKDRYPLGDGIEAIGLPELMGEVAASGSGISPGGR